MKKAHLVYLVILSLAAISSLGGGFFWGNALGDLL
jgi:hypothetical protein